MIQSVADRMKPAFEEENIIFTANCTDGGEVAFVDPERFQQIY